MYYPPHRKNVENIANAITINLLENDVKIPYIREETHKLMRKLPNHEEYDVHIYLITQYSIELWHILMEASHSV